MNLLVILLDLTGLLAFSVASFYAYRNHEAVKFATKMWWYFANASVTGALWSLVVLLDELGVKLPFDAGSALFFAVVFLFTLFSVTSYFNFIKPLESK
jgi:hypothetical protein